MSKPAKAELSLGIDDAYQVVAEMPDSYLTELGGCDVHTGKHPKHGNIRVLIPAAGDALLLYPFELQAA